jgi:hypothetical protein
MINTIKFINYRGFDTLLRGNSNKKGYWGGRARGYRTLSSNDARSMEGSQTSNT